MAAFVIIRCGLEQGHVGLRFGMVVEAYGIPGGNQPAAIGPGVKNAAQTFNGAAMGRAGW